MIETEYIRRAQKGDGEAVRELYRRYAPRVYAVVRRLAGDEQLAEDWAQEAWVRAIRALPNFRGDARFSTWLHRIAVNAVLGRMRKSKREQDRLQVADELNAAHLETGDSGTLRDLTEAVDRLPDGARHVFVLNAVYGYTHEEAADMLGIAAGTSKAQLHRARRLLAQQLKEQGFDE